MNSIIKKYNYSLGSKYQAITEKTGQYQSQHGYYKLGLETIAQELEKLSHQKYKELQNIIAPEKKLIVMIIGNHSAGKSSFINWYVDANVQKTKVSIETIEMNIITQGNQSAEFNGYNAMQMLPFLDELYEKEKKQEKFPGLLENLTLKSVPSNAKQFKNIVFIDTPGLADGELSYKFDIENAIQWFANRCDLILSFIDPNGQALCKRTNNLIALLNKIFQQKLHFYMTKGDMFDNEDDKYKCMCQITQGLSTALPPMHGFEMPVIYIPNINRDKQNAPRNQINDLIQLFDKKIQVKAQFNLSKFGQDLRTLDDTIKQMKQEQARLNKANKCIENIVFVSSLLQIVCLVLFFASLIDFFTHGYVHKIFHQIQGDKSAFHFIFKFILGIAFGIYFVFDKLLIHEFNTIILVGCIALIPIFFFLSKVLPQKFLLCSAKVAKQLETYHLFVMQTNKKYQKLSQRLNDRTFIQFESSSDVKFSEIGNDPLGNTSCDDNSVTFESASKRSRKSQQRSLLQYESDEDSKINDSKKFK